MNFIHAVLKFLDAYWSMLTLPALLLGVSAFINFLPIPTLLIMLMFIGHQFDRARLLRRIGDLADIGEEAHDAEVQSCINKAVILIIGTAIAYGFWIYTCIKRGGLCEDTSDMIPLTLAQILQWVLDGDCIVK